MMENPQDPIVPAKRAYKRRLPIPTTAPPYFLIFERIAVALESIATSLIKKDRNS